MKRFCFLLILMAVFLLSCTSDPGSEEENSQGSTNDDDTEDDTEAVEEITGHVMDKSNDEILVVDPEENTDAGGEGEHYSAVWFSNVEKDVSLGQKVTVGYDMIQESYPGQASPVNIETIETDSPEAADLNEAEAFRNVLPTEEIEVPVVTDISYDGESDLWSIELMDGQELLNEHQDNEVFDFEIDDEKNLSEATFYDYDNDSEPVFTIENHQEASELRDIFESADECVSEVDVPSPDYEVEFKDNQEYRIWTETTEIMTDDDAELCSISEEDENRFLKILENYEDDG